MHLLPIAFILKIYRFDHREVLEEELIPRSEHSGSEEHWFRVDRYDKSRKCLLETRLFLKFLDEIGKGYAVCLEWIEKLQHLIEVNVVLDL